MRRYGGLEISKSSLIYIATLFALSISHPLYDLLTQGDHATFFIAHQSKAADVYILVGVISVLLPLFLFSALVLLNLFSATLARFFYAAVLIALFGLLFLLGFESLTSASGNLELAIALLAGLMATYLFIIWPLVRFALAIMSAVVLLSPLMFLNNPSIRGFLATPEAQDYSLISKGKDLPSVVMIIFDELPLTSLLDENRNIDEVRFPNFARLARQSHWFRNTSTTHFSTRSGAIPSILTGWYPDTYRKNSPEKHTDSNAPIRKENMPKSIFSLLEPTHRIFAIESMSQLAPLNQSVEIQVPGIDTRLPLMFCDALVVYGHLVVPGDLKELLPTIHGQWKDYCSFEPDLTPPSVEWPYGEEGKPGEMKRFIELLKASKEPSFYYIHLLLPHFPFQYDMNGQIHEDKTNIMTGIFRWATGENHWRRETVANLTYQAHLIQLVFTDHLLGRVLDRLEATNLFNKSMIIVTADHGATFYWDPNDLNPNDLTRIQASDTMYVPLFIKMPDQTEALVSDRLVETIDILPTLTAALKLEPEWSPDGVSVFAEKEPDRDRVAYLPRKLKYGKVIDPAHLSLKRKVELFGTGSLDGLYQMGPHKALIGRSVSSFPVGQSEETAVFLRPKYRERSSDAKKVQAYVEGYMTNVQAHFDVEQTKIAVAVNGIILNTTNSTDVQISELGKGTRINGHRELEPDGNVHFLARIPLEGWSEEQNDVSVYVINENQEGQPISLVHVDPAP